MEEGLAGFLQHVSLVLTPGLEIGIKIGQEKSGILPTKKLGDTN